MSSSTTTTTTTNSNNQGGNHESSRQKKQLILIRHGTSYMNEYIGKNGISWGSCPNFTDIFSLDDHERYYRDSPLSPAGQEQAQELYKTIGSMLLEQQQGDDDESDENQHKTNILEILELVVISPLTRAMQTAQIALLPHIMNIENHSRSSSSNSSPSAAKQKQQVTTITATKATPNIPIIVLPLAAERLYLVSDIGRSRAELKQRDYDGDNDLMMMLDFETGFPQNLGWNDPWWFQYGEFVDEYVEWRPTGQGQTYFCPGEPWEAFHQRMVNLCQWLQDRPESTIALVGHFGVFEWLLRDDNNEDDVVKFANCEMRVVDFESIYQKSRK